MTAPAADVVVPCRNGARTLARCLDSVLAQSPAPAAVFVVDDGSTDDTASVLASYGGRVRVLHNDRSRGPGAARNRGVAAGDSPLIGFLDCDDAWLPGMIESQIRAFARDPGIGLCYSGVVDCDEELRPLGPPRPYPKRRAEWMFREIYLRALPIPPSATFLRRDALEASGPYAEDLPVAEDLELSLRLALRFPFSCTAEPLLLRRRHRASTTLTAGIEEHMRCEAEVWERCARAAAELGVPLPMPAAERIVVGRRRRMRHYLAEGNRTAAGLYREDLAARGALRARDEAAYRVGRARWLLTAPLRAVRARRRS